MAKKDTFEKMYNLYNAIVDIDKIVNSPNEVDMNGECKLDQVLFYVRDIPKKDYPEEYTAYIISSIRASIVELYNKTLQEINKDIITGDNAPNPIISGLTKPSDSNMDIPNFLLRPTRHNIVGQPIGSAGVNKKNYVERGMVHAGAKTD